MLLNIQPRTILDRYPHRCPGEGCAVCAFVAGQPRRAVRVTLTIDGSRIAAAVREAFSVDRLRAAIDDAIHDGLRIR